MAGMKVRRSIIRAALAATAVTLLGAGGAQAATVTIGSPLTAPFAPVAFGNTTQANFPNPSSANPTSPVAGTVISWRFIGSGLVAPRVLRRGEAPSAASTAARWKPASALG